MNRLWGRWVLRHNQYIRTADGLCRLYSNLAFFIKNKKNKKNLEPKLSRWSSKSMILWELFCLFVCSGNNDNNKNPKYIIRSVDMHGKLLDLSHFPSAIRVKQTA